MTIEQLEQRVSGGNGGGDGRRAFRSASMGASMGGAGAAGRRPMRSRVKDASWMRSEDDGAKASGGKNHKQRRKKDLRKKAEEARRKWRPEHGRWGRFAPELSKQKIWSTPWESATDDDLRVMGFRHNVPWQQENQNFQPEPQRGRFEPRGYLAESDEDTFVPAGFAEPYQAKRFNNVPKGDVDGWLMPGSKKPKSIVVQEIESRQGGGHRDKVVEHLMTEEYQDLNTGLMSRRDHGVIRESKFSKMHNAVQRLYKPLPWKTVEKTSSLTNPSNKTWQELGLDLPEDELMMEIMQAAGVDGPNKLQEMMVPGMLTGKDTLLTSQTGSGKTLTFLLPLLHRHVMPLAGMDLTRKIDPRIPTQFQPKVLAKPRLMIVSPTKDLAAQIYMVCRDLLRPFPQLNVTLLIGGNNHARQDEALKFTGPVVVVGTPGRILDHHEEGRLVFDDLKGMVLDEVDALLSVSRTDHISMLVKRTFLEGARRVQTILASATGAGSQETTDFAERHLRRPWLDTPFLGIVMPSRVLHLVNGAPDMNKKIKFLKRLVSSDPEPSGIIVFCNNFPRAQKVVKALHYMDIGAELLSGNRTSYERQRAMRNMAKGNIQMLVVTDVASRGLDFREMTHVVNFETPGSPECYAHRAGRVGRAGYNGLVISLASGGAKNYRLNRYARELQIDLHECNVYHGNLGVIPDHDVPNYLKLAPEEQDPEEPEDSETDSRLKAILA